MDLARELAQTVHVHDSSPLAWLAVAAYFVASALAFLGAISAEEGRERWFWVGCAVLLLLLGLNKELDVQSAITGIGRSLAREQGWYGERRLVQAVFVLACGAVAGAVIVALSIWLRRSAVQVKLAAVGLVLLFAFIILRAASFHHMDGWVTHRVAGMRGGWWLELGGIIVIGLCAAAYRWRRPLNHGGEADTLSAGPQPS